MVVSKKTKPKHLGRGLQALLSPINNTKGTPQAGKSIVPLRHNIPPDNDLENSLLNVDVNLIKTNPYQPRTTWDTEQLNELADSIKTSGVIQPIIVRRQGSDFQLIAGERRLRAAKIAGLEKIPALVRDADEEQMLEMALIENIQRSDLNPIEHAKAYRRYINSFSLTQDEAAKKLGKSRSVIANHIRLLDLPDEIKQMLSSSELSMGHARAILSLPTDELRRKLANRAMAGRLSVREVERLVRLYTANPDSEKTSDPSNEKPAHIKELEMSLSSQLGTKVRIETKKNSRRGKIIIEFYSLDEFDRITESLGLSSAETV